MTFKRNIILSVAFTLCAAPVFALSCLPPDVTRSFHDAAESEDSFAIVYGQLKFDEDKLPEVDFDQQENTPPDTFIPATLDGKALGKTGFVHAFDQKITLNAQCFGPWCSGAASGTDYLAFLKKTDEGYVLELNPCGGMAFGEPSQEILDQVAQCMAGGPCKEKHY